MGRRKKYAPLIPNKYVREQEYTLDTGRTIEHGEIIKISGEYGSKFKFLEHVVNTENGAEWIDCFELRNGVNSGWRSFRPDRIKPLPKTRRRRTKNV